MTKTRSRSPKSASDPRSAGGRSRRSRAPQNDGRRGSARGSSFDADGRSRRGASPATDGRSHRGIASASDGRSRRGAASGADGHSRHGAASAPGGRSQRVAASDSGRRRGEERAAAASYGANAARGRSGRGAAAEARRIDGPSHTERKRRGRGKANPAGSFSPQSFRRKGEWMEGVLPPEMVGESFGHLLRLMSAPPKLAGKLIERRDALLAGNLMRLRLFPKEPLGMPADWLELNVLYEDDFLLAVNKPAGLEVHPSTAGQRHTLANGVAAYYEATGQACRVRPLHRLDKDTTGPVLFAKNEWAQQVMERSLREKALDRRYLALAEGVLRETRGVIDKPIGQDRHHSTRRRVSETGERAVTYFETVERLGDHTLLRLQLETGRTHQIRVHLSAIGHPIAGDGMYGGGRKLIHRQALHGESLQWVHPWTREKKEVRAPVPEDFQQALRELRREH